MKTAPAVVGWTILLVSLLLSIVIASEYGKVHEQLNILKDIEKGVCP